MNVYRLLLCSTKYIEVQSELTNPTATMKIIRAEHLGMCFGVRDAIALAQGMAAREPLTILGDLVHNETVLKDLRARGFRFVGPTICYAFMQAVGMVNDHLVGCPWRERRKR